MTDAPVPAKTTQTATADPRKLDDVLLAMDVVDTLRHRERLVDQELNAEAREEQLIARLKEIYGAQGIEVPDSIIAQGVKALKESRFVYTPAPPSFKRPRRTRSRRIRIIAMRAALDNLDRSRLSNCHQG